MRATKAALITGPSILLVNPTPSPAIEGLKLSVHCPDVWLTWPSTENGETYIVQYRETLDTNSSWITLTNYMPADTGTNLTVFVHSNMITCPSGLIIGMNRGAGSANAEMSPTEALWGQRTLKVYRPGSQEHLLFEVTYTVPENNAERSRNDSGQSGTGDGPQPPGPGGTGGPDTGFYRVVRNGVHIFGLTNETVLSGTVTLPIEAGYVDGDPLETISLTANGTPISDVFPLVQPLSGLPSFTVDTSRLANGTYYLQPSGRWRVEHTNTFESPTLQLAGVNGDTVQVYVTNAICYPDWVSEVGDSSLLILATSAYTNISWRVDLYGQSGDFIRAFTNHSDDGTISLSWDLSDTNGYPRGDILFTSVTTIAQASSTNSAASTNPPLVKLPDNYPDQGRWIVARADIIPDDFRNFDQFTNAINTIAGMGEQGGGVLPSTGRNFGEAFVVHVGNITNWASLFRAFTNQVRNFYWFGHGSEDTIEDGARSLASTDVAHFLGNQPPWTNATRYRFVWLDGCSTALGNWPIAFGMGNRENVPYSSYTSRPAAFAGYTRDVYGHGGHTSVTLAACYYRSQFVFDWTFGGYDVKDAFDDARVTSNFTEASALKVYGYWGLDWNSLNRKQDWP